MSHILWIIGFDVRRKMIVKSYHLLWVAQSSVQQLERLKLVVEFVHQEEDSVLGKAR